MSKVYDKCLQKNCVFLDYVWNVLWWHRLSFFLKNESGCHISFKYCCRTPPTATSLASHVLFNWAIGSGCTRRVAFANICLDSENADSAFSSQFNSKFDFGDSLVWPLLAAVNKLFNGVNFAAHCGDNNYGMSVQASVISTWSPVAIFLWYHMKRWGPFTVVGFDNS